MNPDVSEAGGRRLSSLPAGARYLDENDLADAGFKSLGRHVQVHQLAHLYGLENISLGDHVRIDPFSVTVASGPVSIGAHAHINNFCHLYGVEGIFIDEFCNFSSGVKVFTHSDDFTGGAMSGPTIPKKYLDGPRGPIRIGRHVILGAGTAIMPDLTIGDGCTLGALSLVKQDLDPWGVYAGIPVRRIKERSRRVPAWKFWP